MYLFFDSNGTLKEQITTSPVRYGDESGVNKIYAYWDTENVITDSWCILRKPNGDNTNTIFGSIENNVIIPYDQDRDLKFFKYNTPYNFCVYEIPSEVFDEIEGINIYSVLGSIYMVYNNNQSPKTMGLFAFAVEPSTLSVATDQNINIAQWNELIKMVGGNPDFNDISVKTIIFKESLSASASGLSMVNNVIYWKGTALTTASDLTDFITQSDLASYVQFSDLENYAQKSDLESYVNLTSNQNINGEKSFLGTLRSGPNGAIEINRLTEDEIVTIRNIDNDNQKIDTYKIVMVAESNDNTYTLTLPAGTGTLALVSDILSQIESNAVLKGNINQEVDGIKTFIKNIRINGGMSINSSHNEGKICEIDYLDTTTFKHDVYGILVDTNTNTRQVALKLPNKSGTLLVGDDLINYALKSEVVDLVNNQTINGTKTFNNDIVLNNKKLFIDNATISANGSSVVLERLNVIDNENNGNEATYDIKSGNIDNDGAEYEIFLPQESGTLLSENGFQRVTGQKRFKHLNVDIETSASPTVNGALWYKSGKFYGRKTGSDKEFLMQDALTPTFITATSTSEASVVGGESRNCFKFEIGADYNGIYVFTHSYLMMLVPIYGLTENQIYKFAGPGIQDWDTGSVISFLYNMKRSGNYLYIWSGRTEYQLVTGITGTLAKVKLY